MKKYFRLVIIIIGSLGILALIFNDAFITNSDSPFNSLRLFKYFTVQSNLVAVIYFLILLGMNVDKKNEKWINFVGGVMIYTTITFLVFAIILEPLYQEKGFALLGSICLHYINPLLIIAYVISNRNDFTMKIKDTLFWVIYPLFYLLFLIINGLITGDYLYPFFQISEIGVVVFIAVIIGLIGLFFSLSFFVVKILSKK